MDKNKMQCTISPPTPMYINDASNQFTIHFQKYEAAQSKQDTPYRGDGDARIYVVPALGTGEKALCTKEQAQNIIFDLTSGYSGCTMQWEDSGEGCFFVSIPDYAPDKEFTATFRTRSFRTTAREGITDLLVSIRGFEDIEDTDMVLSLTKCYPIKMECLKTTPECVELGQSYMLSWKVLNACYCTIDGEQVNAEGSKNYNAESPVLHRLLANNQFGAVAGGEVWVKIKPPQILEFSCDTKRFNPGDTITASYNVCSANRISVNPEIGNLTKLKDEISIRPAHTKDYVLTAYGYDGKLASAVSKTINVIKADNRWELTTVPEILEKNFKNKVVAYKHRFFTYDGTKLVCSTTLMSWEVYLDFNDYDVVAINIYNNILIVVSAIENRPEETKKMFCVNIINLDQDRLIDGTVHKVKTIPDLKPYMRVIMVNETSFMLIYNKDYSNIHIYYRESAQVHSSKLEFSYGKHANIQFAVLKDKIYAVCYEWEEEGKIYCNDYKSGDINTWTLVNKMEISNLYFCLVTMLDSIYLVTDRTMQDILKVDAKAESLPTFKGDYYNMLMCEGDKLRIINWNGVEKKHTLIWEYII